MTVCFTSILKGDPSRSIVYKKPTPSAGHYIAGFVDGEGSFYMTARPRKDFPTGWKFDLGFNISNNDRRVLNYCQSHLRCGTIRESRPGSYVLEVADKAILFGLICPFFHEYRFRSDKKLYEFFIFEKILNRLIAGPIQTQAHLNEILILRKQLSKYRIQKFKNLDDEIQTTFKEVTD